jgi:hypothetical protein
MLDRGDREGRRVWKRIRRAIVELQACHRACHIDREVPIEIRRDAIWALNVLKCTMFRRLARLHCDALDRADYLVTLARLRVLDWIAGPEPETEADLRRGAERERLRTAFPKMDLDHPTPRRHRPD